MTIDEPAPSALPRRMLLASGGAVVAGIALLKAEPAAATTGAMQYGVINDAGADYTQLSSSSATGTLRVVNSSVSTGSAIYAEITDAANYSRAIIASTYGVSHAFVGEQNNPTAQQAAVVGVHYGLGVAGGFVQDNEAAENSGIWGQTAGAGAGVHGSSYGTGIGVLGTSATAAAGIKGTNSSTGPAVYGTNSSSGVGVWGSSAEGRGGQFAGAKAQVRLVPSEGTRPAVGKTGDFFVDNSKQLWFCKGGNQWVKLA